MPARAGATGDYVAPPEQCKSAFGEEAPVTKGVPAGGDIAEGGGRQAVAGRLSLEGGSFPAGWAVDD